MNGHAHTVPCRHRHYSPEKFDEIATQLCAAESAKSLDFGLQGLAPIRTFTAGKTGNNAVFKLLNVDFAERAMPIPGSLAHFGRVVLLGALSAQHEQIISGELRNIEAQRRGAVGQAKIETRARPIEHRHKIVTNDANVKLGKIAQGLAVIRYSLLAVACSELNVAVNGYRFNDRPLQARRFNLRMALADFFKRPDIACRHMVQRRNDAAGACLGNLLQRNRIARSEPAPTLFHNFDLRFFSASGLCYEGCKLSAFAWMNLCVWRNADTKAIICASLWPSSSAETIRS